MLNKLENDLLNILSKTNNNEDPSHDIYHILRVLKNAKYIGKKENADLEIVIPAAIFHDLVTYPKNDPRNKFSVTESAEKAKEILNNLNYYPTEKIEFVEYAIKCSSFSFGLNPINIEDKVVKDADLLEATGAISIMRTFATSGIMKRTFYNENDPFCNNREVEPFKYSVDLFYDRLLKVEKIVSTKTGKQIAKRRTKLLKTFLKELENELNGK